MELTGNIGFELEMSDIVTSDAARIVYGSHLLLPEYAFGYNKPELDYSRWNLVPDSTIKNSDGTQCMKSFIEDGIIVKAKNNAKSPHRFKWKGAELISPVINIDVQEEVIKYFGDLEFFLKQFKDKGATFSGELNNSLHVHVDVQTLSPDEIRKLVTHIYFSQDILYPLKTDWSGSRKFSEEEMSRLWGSLDAKEFWKEYCTVKGKSLEPNRIGVRRFIDVGPYFSNLKNYQTVEFRCFKAKDDPIYILNCIYFSLWFVQTVLSSDYFEDYEEDLKNWVSSLKRMQNVS